MHLGKSRWPVLIMATLLLGLVFATYASSLSNGPVWDDRPLVTENPFLLSFDGLRVLLENDLWTASAKREPSSFYRPFAMVTFWINAQLTGPCAAAMRAGNIFLHAINAILLFLLLLRLIHPPRLRFAALVAALWAVLAINSEPVLWISGRFDPLTTMAALGCLLANRVPGVRGVVLVVACTACGLLSKEAFMGWIPLLLLDDLLLLRRSIRPILPKYASLGALIGLNVLLRRFVDLPSLSVVSGTGVVTIIESYLFTFTTLVSRAFLPLALDPFHPYVPLPLWLNGVMVVVLVVLSVWIAWRALRSGSAFHARLTAFGWCWLLIGLFPASLTGPNLFMIGDRYAYLPMVGLLLMVYAELTPLLGKLEARFGRMGLDAVGVLLLVGIAGQSFALLKRIPDWRDDRTLAEASLRAHPENPYALYTLGAMAVEDWKLEEAEPLLMRAAVGNPRCWRTPNAICVLRLRQERFEEARTACHQSIAFHPRNPRAWVNLASVYVNEKRWAPALEASLRAVEIKPFFPEARYLAAVSSANLGDLAQAQQHLQAGLEEDPGHERLLDLAQQMLTRP